MGDLNQNQCNHKIKDENTTIKLAAGMRTFTYPEHVYGVCGCCGKQFHYVRSADGTLELYKNKKGEE